MSTSRAEQRNVVMIIDDDPDIRSAMELVLEGCGYSVVGAGDGAAALRQLESGERLPCLILLDLRMPGMDGQQFREAQLERVRLAGVPVVVLSGDADIEARAKELGIARFLMKPVDIDQLLDEIARHCSSR